MASDDFIPLTTPSDDLQSEDQSQSAAEPSSALSSALAERLKMARVTMEGPERAIARERNEKSDRIHNQIKKMGEELAMVTKRKEDLEIAWVVLDNKRNDLKKMLAPILAEEEKMEVKEDELEGKERTTLLPSDRQRIEKERWQAQEERRKIEVKKWELEDKVAFLENQIGDNTKKYQELLDQEGTLRTTLDSLEEELNIMAEQIRLEDEDKKRQTVVQAELHQKEIKEKKKEEEIKTHEAPTKKMADTVKPANPVSATPIKSREDLLKEAEDNRRRMQEEIARITGNLNTKTAHTTPATPTPITLTPETVKEEIAVTPIATKETPKEELVVPTPATTAVSADTSTTPVTPISEPIKINIIRQAAPNPTAKDGALTAPATEPKMSSQITTPTPAPEPHYREEIAKDDLDMTKKEEPAPLMPPITTTEDKLPKVRTMQSDLANLTGQAKK